ncbi:AMP-binding protein [Granulosicoccus antarcticus]|uniref:Long-chain-fatty-acid--CoA ligase n=1 Tax=Granulosicoccus antarcticus IMCC3135 TaxID=1192854 RepID=A0A2Z2NZJ1_9GAMM|nr:AMP-binding protein [Granulosicoccus antarcticus]ASJ76683.1 Long-chain-fatty-acid--CoA ligase [Granulosicoccus antarcticus IMCC3135]
MEKPWLQSYPPGVPEDIDTHAYASVVDIFTESTQRFAERPAFQNMGKSITYQELDQLTQQFASWCQHEAGLQKGDRIAIMMPNLLQYPVIVFGALRAGLVVVNTNPLYTERELEHQLKDSGAKAIVVVEAFAHTLAEVIDKTEVKTVVLTRFGDMLGFPKSLLVNFVIKYVKKMVPPFSLPGAHHMKDVLAKGASLPPAVAELEQDDLAFLQYTGGTTGVAKGAMLTHRNMVCNIQQAWTWINAIKQKEGHEVIITALPLYHIFALTANCLTYMKMGALNLLITNPRDMPGFVKELGKHPFTAITGVNTLFNALMNTPGFDKIDFSHLKLTLGGGMAVQKSVADRWKEITGITLIEAYGLTETSPAACINPMDLEEYNDSIGLPLSSTEASIRDTDNKEVPMGETGELCIRGPQVMKGYWQRPKETAEAVDSEGWLHTGDVAIMNEKGFFKIVDRLKDMILVSGFNVYPNEIEAVLSAHPGILEVGAIGIPDEHSGEIVKVVIVRKDPALTEADIKAYCKEELTGYKRPKVIQFVDDLPKTNVGKILRRELREL